MPRLLGGLSFLYTCFWGKQSSMGYMGPLKALMSIILGCWYLNNPERQNVSYHSSLLLRNRLSYCDSVVENTARTKHSTKCLFYVSLSHPQVPSPVFLSSRLADWRNFLEFSGSVDLFALALSSRDYRHNLSFFFFYFKKYII